MMLEGSDRLSYELTLMSFASNIHDAHVVFSSTDYHNRLEQFDHIFGRYVAPVRVTEAEGHLVVDKQIFISRRYEHTLMPGDIVLEINGINIDEVVADMLQYVSYPNEEKALFFLANFFMILRQHSADAPMEFKVLRDGVELMAEAQAVNRQSHAHSFFSPPTSIHQRLENNIGLINPSRIQAGDIPVIMEYFADTNGLIVDLRQNTSGGSSILQLAEYLVEETQLFIRIAVPSQATPGVFVDFSRNYSGGFRGQCAYAFLYKNNVVVLINEGTLSVREFQAMSLRNGSNVTVMGSNSIGANGNITRLPLPGGVTMRFSGLGVFTPEGGQTQRIGLSPDIRVERTVAGIRDGRDELLEAAIQHLTGNPFPR